MRRNRSAEVIDVVLSVLIVLLCIALFIFNEEYPILFTVVFGAAAFAFLIKGFHAVRFGTNRKEKTTGGLLYGVLALVFAGIAYVAFRVRL